MKPRVWPVFVAFVLAVVVMGIVTVVVEKTLSPAAAVPLADRQLDAGMLIRGALISVSVLVVFALLFARPRGAARLRLAPGRGGWPIYVAATVGTITLAQIDESLTRLLGLYAGSTLEKFEQALAAASGAQVLLVLLLVGAGAGFAEELFFRGFMQTRLAERWRPWVAVVVTSLVFGVMHFDPVHMLVAFMLGLWLGFVTERTGSIRAAIVAHVLNNSLATALAAAGVSVSATTPVIALGIVALLLFLVCARYVAGALPAVARAAVVTGPALTNP